MQRRGECCKGDGAVALAVPGERERRHATAAQLAAEEKNRISHRGLALQRLLARVREAKARGLRVTCEVTPHHLALTDQAVADSGYDTDTKMSPPLRAAEGVRLGRIGRCLAPCADEPADRAAHIVSRTPVRALNSSIDASQSAARARMPSQNAGSRRATKSSIETPCCSTHV